MTVVLLYVLAVAAGANFGLSAACAALHWIRNDRPAFCRMCATAGGSAVLAIGFLVQAVTS